MNNGLPASLGTVRWPRKLFVGSLLVVVAVMMAAMPAWAAPKAPDGTVLLRVDPAAVTVTLAEEFQVTFVVEAGVQPVDAVDAFLSFDPALLEVLALTPGTTLPTLLASSFDNTAGRVRYSAGKQLGGPDPTGTFDLATIRFRSRNTPSLGGTPLAYVFQAPASITDVFHQGLSVLGSIQGSTVTIDDFLAVTLVGFSAQAEGSGIVLVWETGSEVDNVGFNLYRNTVPDQPGNRLVAVPSQSPGSSQGASYSYADTAVEVGKTYWYWLEDVDLSGAATLHGPVSATVQTPTAVGLASFESVASSDRSIVGLALAAGLALVAGGWTLRRRRLSY